MINPSFIKDKYKTIEIDKELFSNNEPLPLISLSNFLPTEDAYSLNKECNTIPLDNWKNFTRNGSNMYEFNQVEYMPQGFQVINLLNSSPFLRYLENLTGINSLLPDPHLIGAGYSRSFNGDSLKVHTDFNWNEELKLHRALSLIIYLTPEWKEEFGGGLKFYNQNQEEKYKANCLFNTALIWKYDKYGYHGYNDPISCPEGISRNTLRLFYYVSNSTHNEYDPPHRSLYWTDENGLPYDKREEK